MAMIMAIAFLIIIATLMAVMMNMTANTTKKTENLYFTEQAHLLAKSATEYALLAISGHNRDLGGANSSCIETIASQYPAVGPYFNINTTIRYIGLGNNGTCGTSSFVDNIDTNQTRGTVLIDVTVSGIENSLRLNQNIVYHRRTLQKP